MPHKSVDGEFHVSGHGEPLLLVHGNASTHETWSGVISHLERDFQCITYDLRGHKVQSASVEPYGLDDLVDDLENLRASLNIESAHIVGHSLGGMIAAAYARRYPGRVKTLCMMVTPAGRTADDMAKSNNISRLIQENGVRATLETMVQSWYTDEFVASHPNAIEHRLEQIVAINQDTLLNDLKLYADTEIKGWLGELYTPTLIITGEFAVGCDARMCEWIHSHLRDSELKIFKGLKNGILTEIPEQVADKISVFVRSREVPTPP